MVLSAPPAKRKTRDIGRQAEQFALQYLQAQGMTLVERNFSCRCGEIDLILWYKDTLVFTEVRYRKRTNFGSGADTVDTRKQRKLLASAAYYLQKNPKFSRHPCRFDVVSLSDARFSGAEKHQHNMEINWIPNAFQAE